MNKVNTNVNKVKNLHFWYSYRVLPVPIRIYVHEVFKSRVNCRPLYVNKDQFVCSIFVIFKEIFDVSNDLQVFVLWTNYLLYKQLEDKIKEYHFKEERNV